MSRAEQIKALIRSHAKGDDTLFYAAALQIAATAERAGQVHVARELRRLVDESKVIRSRRPTSSPAQVSGKLAGLLSVEHPKTRLNGMALDSAVEYSLKRVVQEYRRRDLLRSHGLSPMRKLLLAGPPGTGKTMSASALAGELGLPMFIVQLDGLISKFMGETASKLRLVFSAVAETQGVYLFDEFDALGGERGVGNAPGEIHRALNSLLQFLENDNSDSLLIGATNLVEILDKALFRRFDAVLNYSRPSPKIALDLMRTCLGTLGSSDIDWGTVSPQVQGLSHAELKLACEQAAKDALLKGTTAVSTAALIDSLNTRQAMSGGARQ